jgi:hypothetical protein
MSVAAGLRFVIGEAAFASRRFAAAPAALRRAEAPNETGGRLTALLAVRQRTCLMVRAGSGWRAAPRRLELRR